jgi:hypothetical protein
MNEVGELGGFWGLGVGGGSVGVRSVFWGAVGLCVAFFVGGFGAAGRWDVGADFWVEEEVEEPD